MQSVTKDQRREYKSKFVDMDIEFQRMRERLENVHLILDDMQVLNQTLIFGIPVLAMLLFQILQKKSRIAKNCLFLPLQVEPEVFLGYSVDSRHQAASKTGRKTAWNIENIIESLTNK